jgi:hypothetical protein
MFFMKHLKFILPVLFILLIFNYSYAQLSQRSKVDSTIEGTRLFERGKNFFSHGLISS